MNSADILPINNSPSVSAALMKNDAINNYQTFYKDYKWYNSCNLSFEISLQILRLELPADIDVSNSELLKTDIYITTYIVCNAIIIHESPISTLFANIDINTNSLVWDYLLSFPCKIKDLSLDSKLIAIAWTADGKIFGSTSISFFNEKQLLKQGKQKLMFYYHNDHKTLYEYQEIFKGESYHEYEKHDYPFFIEKNIELFTKNQNYMHKNNIINKTEWLDRYTLSYMTSALAQSSVAQYSSHTYDDDNNNGNEGKQSYPKVLFDKPRNYLPMVNNLETFTFLIIELPILQHPVLFEEKFYQTAVMPHIPPTTNIDNPSLSINEMLLKPYMIETNQDTNIFEFSLIGKPAFNPTCLTICIDWDMDSDNLAEDQNRKLNQHSRRGIVDATAKPNKTEKEIIDKIINSVSIHMTTEEIDLLYKYRYTLTENKKAIIKFLYAVNWDDETEIAEIPLLFSLWSKNAPVDIEDALKLLSKDRCFEHSYVREYAVAILKDATDEELLTFLLQLVQALRYEPVVTTITTTISSSSATSTHQSVTPNNHEDKIESLNNDNNNAFQVIDNDKESIPATIDTEISNSNIPVTPVVPIVGVSKINDNLSPLANFLIERACASSTVANYFYWYLKVETEDETAGMLFQSVFDSFIVHLSTSGEDGKLLFRRLCALDEYISKISSCQRDARDQGRRKEGKEEFLRKFLKERNLHMIPKGVDWIPMPLDPTIQLSGLIPQTASMFASAVYPCVIEFIELLPQPSNNNIIENNTATTNDISNPATSNSPIINNISNKSSTNSNSNGSISPTLSANTKKTHKIMFKSGDDLRQDQLVMQLIALMDRLLKKVNLDLKLLTYGILAVGQNDGLMEFVVGSMPISAVQKHYNNSIAEYLKHHNLDKSAPYEIAPKALDTFIKSCAGYCVVTYILGVGDRHLDNIMIKPNGQMFHIDFGFIFGQDPKPMPPPFRFTRSMADAMGGEDSEHYARFKTFCCQSYNWLRKSANLILNLLSLMGDAGIQDISKRSDLSKVLIKVQEKFRLDLTDEEAEQFFIGLIHESLHALAPKMMELAHKIAVSMR